MEDDRSGSDAPSAANVSSTDGPAVTGSGRAIQACDRCRMKKVRCDGLLPACSRCKTAGLECLTMIKLTRKSYPRSYTESIEERLRDVEAEVQRLRDENTAGQIKIRELEAAAAAARGKPPSHPSPQDSESSRVGGLIVSGRRDNRAKSRRNSVDDSICREVGRMNSDRSGVGRFMGSSSGIFFVGMAQQRFSTLSNVQWKVGHDLLKVETDDHSVDYKIHPSHLRQDFLQELPPYETAIKYCDAWFEFWRYIFPILHRPTFMRNLELMYFKQQTVPDNDIPAEIFAIFYLVLAVGSRQIQLSGDNADSRPHIRSSGDDTIYFEKAMSYYDEVMKLGTVRTIQFQELLILWYVSTGKRSLAFQMAGILVRLSLELGLHRHSKRFNFNPVTTEIRKRTFWVCYILDSFISTIAGLPKSLRDQDIDTDGPSEVDDDMVSAEGYLTTLPGEPTGMMAFVSLVKVARIVARAQEILYTTTNRRGTSAKIRILDRLLDQWANTLPDHFQINFNELSEMSPEEALADLGQGAPEVVFMQLVYLYTRLLIHRPALSFKPQTDQSQRSLLRCMETSMQTILLLSYFKQFLLLFDINPGAHVYTFWQCGLMSMYGILELREARERYGSAPTNFELEAIQSANRCLALLDYMVSCGRDGEEVRAQNIRDILAVIPLSVGTGSVSEPGSTPGVERQTSISSPFATAPQLVGAGTQEPKSPFSMFLGSGTGSGPLSPFTQILNHSTDFIAPPAPQPEFDSTHAAVQHTFSLDFSNDITHPYDRFGISDGAMFMTNSPPQRGRAASGRTPRDIWDDPVFAYSGSPQMEQLPAQSAVVVGPSARYEAGPEAKRMRFAKPL